MISGINKYIEGIPSKWARWLFFGIGLTILIFNDRFGDADNELFILLSLLYFLTLIFLLLRWAFAQTRQIINLRNEQKKTELMHLQQQVNPHFFFNILNSLYGWVDKDAKTAQDLILKLSDLMRYSIYDGQQSRVKISEELAYIENFIELHRVRYHEELDIEFNKEMIDEEVELMPLLFVILVENAFKHGVENLRKDAFIKIDLKASKKRIEFKVENNFDADEEKKDGGIGIKNLKRRLELVYPKSHELQVSSKGNVYKAKMVIEIND